MYSCCQKRYANGRVIASTVRLLQPSHKTLWSGISGISGILLLDHDEPLTILMQIAGAVPQAISAAKSRSSTTFIATCKVAARFEHSWEVACMKLQGGAWQ